MTISGPKVHDYTDKARRLTVDVVAGSAFELLASVFVFTRGPAELQEYEAGPDWYQQVRRAASPKLLADLKRLGGGDLWLGLIGQAYACPEPRDVDGFLAFLAAADPLATRRQLLAMLVHQTEAGRETLDRAAAGDAEAVAAVAAACDAEGADSVKKLTSGTPKRMLEGIVGLLRRFDDEVFHGGKETAAALARDADEKRALAATLPPERLVETATSGVTFRLQPEVSGVVLVPSAVVRPWVAITEYGSLRIFVYPVSAEWLAADPGSPSPWMLGFYKALADESRLRILNLLASGPASLGEVAERVGLAKSTVVHHLRVLRTAGLVLITVGAEKEYSLRRQAIPEAGRLLSTYLSTPEAEPAGPSRSEGEPR
jgi:DNA-binding transcriptional ArsR family regulator